MKTLAWVFTIGILQCACRADNLKNNDKTEDTTNKLTGPTSPTTTIGDNLLGIWRLANAPNASFMVEKDTIDFLAESKRYAFTLVNDSICIHFATGLQTSHIRLVGFDTLVMTGKKTQTFYRLGN